MRTIRSPGIRCLLLNAISAAFAALALVACVDVESEQPLLSSSEYLFGDEFQLNVYAMVGNIAGSPEISVVRWNAGRYVTVRSGESKEEFIVMQPVGVDEKLILVQRFDGKRYDYFLARWLTLATYEIAPVAHGVLDFATFKRLCVSTNQSHCTITTRAQLGAFVRASSGKPAGAFGGVAVLSKPR